MLFSEEDAPLLKKWIVKRLEDTYELPQPPNCQAFPIRNTANRFLYQRSDADADILADYVLALLRHDGDTETVRALCMAEIPPFLGDDSPTFVQDVFNAIHYKSFIPGASAPLRASMAFSPPTGPSIPSYGNAPPGGPYGAPNGSRKRSYNDRGDGDAQQYPSDPNGRVYKQPRRGGPISGRGGLDNYGGRGGYSRGRPSPMNQGPLPTQGFMPPMPSPPPGMPPFDPTDPASFMYAMQGMGFPTPELGGLPSGPSTQPRKQRCRDYDQKGFCARGNTCMYEHGDNSIFVPPGKTTDEYDPSNARLMARGENNESGTGPVSFGNTRDADRGGRGGRGRGGASRGDRGGQFSNPNRRGGRAEFSSDRPNQDRSKTSIVVENIPEDKFSEDEVREFFTQFGTILDISMRPYKRLAIIKYEDWNAANSAYTSPKVIFDNRFVKVYWFSNTESLPRPAAFNADKDATKNDAADAPNKTQPASEPQIDIEEFARKQEEAQKSYEEKTKRKQEMETARKELEKRQEELAKSRAEEKRKLMEKLAAKTGRSSATPGAELDAGSLAPAGDKTTSQTEALKAQLAELEAEAQSLGLDTSLTDETSFAFRGRGRGRGGYRGRGAYVPRGYRGGFRGRGGAPFAGGTYRLDNRPKTVALTGLDFTDAEKDESLRQYLLVCSTPLYLSPISDMLTHPRASGIIQT